MSIVIESQGRELSRTTSRSFLRTGRHEVLALEADGNSRLVFLCDPLGLAAEQYRILGRRVTHLHAEGGAMLVTTPGPNEGKTLTSVNLAWALADAGHRTCLVDLDFRSPGVSKVLSCSSSHGMDDVLNGNRRIYEVVRQVAGTRMHVITIRSRLDFVGKMLAPWALAPALAQLRTMFPWVILDVAPALPMGDVGAMLPFVDGALLVLRSGKTLKKMIRPTLEILGPKLWGTVLNDSPIPGSAYFKDYGNRKK